MSTVTDLEAREQVMRVERLLGEVERLDGAEGATAAEAIEALVDLYGTVLERVVTAVARAPVPELLATLASDELIGHVLIAHGLLPAPPEFASPGASAPTEVAVQFSGRRPSRVGAG